MLKGAPMRSLLRQGWIGNELPVECDQVRESFAQPARGAVCFKAVGYDESALVFLSDYADHFERLRIGLLSVLHLLQGRVDNMQIG